MPIHGLEAPASSDWGPSTGFLFDVGVARDQALACLCLQQTRVMRLEAASDLYAVVGLFSDQEGAIRDCGVLL